MINIKRSLAALAIAGVSAFAFSACDVPAGTTTASSSDGGAVQTEPKAKDKPKPKITKAQREALEAAESYLDSGHFSKKGLEDQLTSEYGEDFSKKDAAYAIKHVKADYNAEAREAAESYLDSGHFSHNGLTQQLSSAYGEQFTKAQAAQAVKSVGL